MYLSRYSFDGDPDDLTEAYLRLADMLPADSIDLRVVVRRADGLDVYDACPDEATFRAFSVSAEFHGALTSAGFPAPTINGLGDVVSAGMKQPVG